MIIEFTIFLLAAFLLMFLLFFIRLFYKLCSSYETETELYKLQKKEELTFAYYKKNEKAQTEMAYLLHDIKNHLLLQATGNNETVSYTHLCIRRMKRSILHKIRFVESVCKSSHFRHAKGRNFLIYLL